MLIINKISILFIALCLSLNFAITPVFASIQIDGKLKATKTCEALESMRMGGNSDNIHLVKNKIYEVIAKDRNIESHYLIRISDDEQNNNSLVRWVAKNCGKFVGQP